MRYSVDDYPFNIKDVARLMGIHPTDRRGRSRSVSTNANSWDCNCIFCGHKGKMNINFVKNVYNCNYCGAGGGMLALYADYYNLTKKEAFDEICSGLHITKELQDVHRERIETAPVKELQEETNPGQASKAEIHKTYSMLLSQLTLSEKHRQDLMERGLMPAQIEERRYRSTPVFGMKQIVQRLQDAGCTIQGVPGFYLDKDLKWTMNFSCRCSGFLVPMESLDGTISGMQIRLDHPKDGQKYIWFSSVNKYLGVSSGSPTHFIGDINASEIYVTEGGLKGSVSHYLSGGTFLCNAGVTLYKNLPAALLELKQHKLVHVKEAYDMDKLMHTEVNVKECFSCEYKKDCPAYGKYRKLAEELQEDIIRMACPRREQKRLIIQKGCTHVYEICEELGLTYTRCVWDLDEEGEGNGQVKGIDNYYYALKQSS